MKHWFWCLHCYRAFVGQVPDNAEKDPDGSFYLDDIPHKCKFKGCDGHIGDIWDWESVRKHNPQYPETPVEGETYPLYPDQPPSDFKPSDIEVGEDDIWCITMDGAAKLLGISLGKLKIRVLTRRLTKFPYFGKDIIPLPEIAKSLGLTDKEVLEKAQELELNLTLISIF